MTPLLYTTDEAAQALHVCPRTVKKLIASGLLKSIKVGRLRRIPPDECAAFIQRQLAEQ